MKIFLNILFLVISLTSVSQTTLPSCFSDNMVLQQQENVAIWGLDKPETTIAIESSWGASTKTITAADGTWLTTLKTNKASFDRQSLVITGTSKISLNNVLIGEVWFCSGQSNMEMALKGSNNSRIINAENYIKIADNPNIRLFNNAKTSSLTPSFDVNGTWMESDIKSAEMFSAIGYMFGAKLLEAIKVPIGIIESSWGGTRIESWLPKDNLSKYPEIKIPTVLPEELNKQKLPSALYNAMIFPFKNYTVKGFLWYQGEGNVNNPIPYKDYTHDLVNSWRAQWNNKKLPFYFVQITPYAYNKHRKSKILNADLLREAQVKATQEILNTGIVITNDVGNCNNIHPLEKEIIAERLANYALSLQYNFKGIEYKSPEYNAMKIDGDKICLYFNFFNKNKEDKGFKTDLDIKDFMIAGEDKKFYPAQITVNKNQTITVFTNEVKNPVAVRYGFDDCFKGSLFSKNGLPVSVFKTDNWN